MSATVPAVLLLNFNRPDLTAGLIACLRPVQPPKVYFAVDGPRSNKPAEASEVQAVQACAALIDWPCELHTLFRDQNLGCRQAVGQAISWFFSHEEAGIILEDDCHPEPVFFSFCAELLERYSADQRVFSISGFNVMGEDPDFPYSYWFHRASVCWGWASWRDRWASFNEDKQLFDEYLRHQFFEAYFSNNWQADYYKKYVGLVFEGQLNTWDYLWSFAHIRNGAFSIVPRTSMVVNKGLDIENATHGGEIHKRIVQEVDTRQVARRESITHPPAFILNDKFLKKQESVYTYTKPTIRERIMNKINRIF